MNKVIRKTNAFTLMEVLIVVAIIGIIAAIAIPSYTQYVEKARRSDAMQALMGASEAMERYKAANFSYKDADLSKIFSTKVPVDGSTTYYNLKLTVNAAGTGYTLTAEATGSMAGDGNLTINQAGVKTYKGATGWPD